LQPTGFLTSYTYDILGNLTSVAQGGSASRSFSYDSLSRLYSATNPESGTTTYPHYDPAGNVLQRVRPAPNQFSPSNQVTTTYTYDALNRLIQTSYSNDMSGTPTVTTTWDCNSIQNMQHPNYPLGRLGRVDTSEASIAYAYDTMGRTWGDWQAMPLILGTSTANEAYAYDYVGNPISWTNYAETVGGIPVTLSYTYNLASRITSVTSSASDSGHPGTLMSGASYGPFGLVFANLTNGWGEARTYRSNRGWLLSLHPALDRDQFLGQSTQQVALARSRIPEQ
jgi:YD repeat-containing protein